MFSNCLRKFARWCKPIRISNVFFLTALLSLFPAPKLCSAEYGPLIKLLVRKGLITDQEAEDLRAELAIEFAETSAGKITIDDDVKQLKIKTDLRTRYQHESTQKTKQSTEKDRSRWRYRLKLGAFYKFTHGWSAGVQLETAEASDSTNTNFGGYFDKNGDDLFVGQIFIDYSMPPNWADLFNINIGKAKHPFLIQEAFWDSDTNPEGFTQQIGWRREGDHWFILRAGEYIIDEENESKGFSVDDWLFVGQAELRYHFGRKSDLKIAPMLLAETNGISRDFSSESANTPSNENSLSDFGNMLVVSVPVEFTFLWNDIPQKFAATVGWNLNADQAVNTSGSPYRSKNAGDSEILDENGLHYSLKYTAGSPKFFKDWAISFEYRYLEAASLTPNLSDSDFGKNSLNQKGFIVSGAYMLSNSVKFGATLMKSEAIEQNWTSDAADKYEVDLLQIDLSAKF